MLSRYALAMGGVIAMSAVGALLWPLLHSTVASFLLLAIIFAVRFAGAGPAVVAMLASIAAADYFFTEPRFTIGVSANDAVWFAMLAAVSATIILLAESLRRADRTIMERDRSMRLTLSSINEAVICADIEGRVTSMNPVAEHWTGWREKDAVNRPLDEVVNLLNVMTREPVRLTRSRGSVHPPAGESILRGRQQAERPVDKSATPLRDAEGRVRGTVLVLRELDHSDQGEKGQRESERLARVTIDALAGHLCVIDSTGEIAAVNRSWRHFARVQGLRLPGDGVGQNYLTVCDAAAAFGGSQEAAEFAAGIRGVLAGERDEFSLQYSLPVSGETYWFIGRVRRLAREGAVGAVIVHEDVTALKRAQEELRTLNETLEQRVAERTAEVMRTHDALRHAERLATLGEMVAAMGHESRNALQRSQTCLELLARRLRDRPDALELIAGARRAQSDLERLHDELRAYAGPMILDRGPYDLAKCWREAWLHLAQRREGRKTSFMENLGDASTLIEVDPFRMHQVFRNLLENALDACPDPVEITVEARPSILGERMALQIVLRDNGPGVSPEIAEHLFEAFFTTKTKGTGLGMAIVRRIVEAHGGTVGLDTTPGQGLGVILTLPRKGF